MYLYMYIKKLKEKTNPSVFATVESWIEAFLLFQYIFHLMTRKFERKKRLTEQACEQAFSSY